MGIFFSGLNEYWKLSIKAALLLIPYFCDYIYGTVTRRMTFLVSRSHYKPDISLSESCGKINTRSISIY